MMYSPSREADRRGGRGRGARSLLVLVGAAAMAAPAAAQVEFDCTVVDALVPTYGLRETYIYDINDANIAIGTTTGNTTIGISYVGFSWSASGGIASRPLNWPHGLSNTGLAVATGMVLDLVSGQTWNLPLLPATYLVPYPLDINDEGIAVGYVQICNCSNSQGTLQIPYIWDAELGPRTVSVPGATGLRRVNASGIAIGWTGGNAHNDSFFVDLATGGYTMMSDVVPGTGAARVYDINDLGDIVGTRSGTGPVYFYGYQYSPSAGATILPLPPSPYQQAFTPSTINNAGRIAGQIYLSGSPRSCVYDPQRGFRDLNDPDVVAGIPSGFVLMYTSRINNNGWIVGYGAGGGGMYKSFVLRPRTSASCYANCDGSSGSPVLNANDFVCFITRYAAGESYADCDAAPGLSANDFLCFLNHFAAGCS